MEKILVIAAHPDDEVLGMGGTIAKKAAQGKEIYLLIVTDGSTAQYRDNENLEEIILAKKAETAAAAKMLGIKEVFYGNLPDMKLDVTPHIEINSVIEKVVDKIKPDTVFTHFWGDVNKDHSEVYSATVVAARPIPGQCIKNIFCYAVPSSTEWVPNSEFVPNYFVDISGYEKTKANAMSAYKTELRAYPHPRCERSICELDKASGIKVGVSACEEFMLIRTVE